MKIILIGLLVSSNPSASIAAFHFDGKLELRRLGQNVSTIGRLEWIEYGHAYFFNNGKTVVMRPGEDNSDAKVFLAPNNYYFLDRKGDEVVMTESLASYIAGPNLAKVLMEAASEAVVIGGNVVGFRLFDIDKDSIFLVAGLQDNDIILAVNDIPLTSALTAVRTLMSLKNEPRFTVKLNRNGLIKTITVTVK